MATDYGRIIVSGVDGLLERVVARMRENLAKRRQRMGARGPYTANGIATGNLFRSLAWTVGRRPGQVVGRVYGLDYWQFADKGRKPGKPPPTGPLANWARAKGVPASGFALARSIGARGTQGSGFATLATAQLTREVETVATEAANQIATQAVEEGLKLLTS